MATYTSSQSGPFDVASTWGGAGVPADGDSFNVSQGHIVAVTGDYRPTNGFDNSVVYGKLHIQGSGCMLRMNGQLQLDSLTNAYFTEGSNSAPYFLMDPGSILEFNGGDADHHRLYINPEERITVEILGTNPNPQTTITSDVLTSGSASPIPFTDASTFAPGDWITVYMPERAGKDWVYGLSDEGFWIHDIDGNNVYTRKFVGPETTIVAASGNKIVVEDASVFRVGYYLVFGTGNNRNVRQVTDIGLGSNTITLDTTVTGSVVGEKVYDTGCDKNHLSGDKVLRLAAVTTTDAAVGDNTITVNNTNGFSVGDMILIQPNSDNYSEVNYWDYICDYTITNINTSTKVITFTNGYTSSTQTTLQKVTKAGAIVVNATRDTKIRAPEGTAYGTSTQRSYVYLAGSGSYYYRRFKFKNVEFNLGSQSDYNNYACIGMRGRSSYSLTSYGQYVSEFEGNVIYPVYRNSRNTGYIWENDQLAWRNNVNYNAGGEGMITAAGNSRFFGNIHMRNGSWAYNHQSFYGTQEISYNFFSCCGGGTYTAQWGFTGNKQYCFNRYINVGTTIGNDYIYGSGYLVRIYCNRYINPPGISAARKSRLYIQDSYLGNSWDITDPNGSPSYISGFQGSLDTNQAPTSTFGADIINYSVCDNFKSNGVRQYTRSEMRLWDDNEKAWKVYPDYDWNNADWGMGFVNTFFLPAGTTAIIIGTVKRLYSGTTNYPYIWVAPCSDLMWYGRYYGYDGVTDAILPEDNTYVSNFIGFRLLDRFTTACNNDYERRSVTVGPYNNGVFIKAGVVGLSVMSGELRRGWYEKDMEIILSGPQGFVTNIEGIQQLTTRIPIRYGTSANEQKTIWGG